MKLSQKILLDRLIARPVACILNLIVLPVGLLLRRDHSDKPCSVHTIALAKFMGMGSIVRAIPLFSALRSKYPHARFVFITTTRNKVIIESIGGFDLVVYVRDDNIFSLGLDTLRLIVKLWSLRVDLYFDLEVYSAFATIVPLLGLARNRYGFYTDASFFKRALNTHLVYFNDTKHISVIYNQLARACGIKWDDISLRPLRTRADWDSECSSYLRCRGISGGYILVNPNSSDLMFERRWPGEYFTVLIEKLSLVSQLPVILVGGPQERGYVQECVHDRLSGDAKRMTVNSCGDISLGAVISLIRGAACLVTNDSGLYHIAATFNIPIVSLWGPVDPAHYSSLQANEAALYGRLVYCTPCLHRTDFPPCRGNNVCMKSIAPWDVYRNVCALISKEPGSDTGSFDEVYKRVFKPGPDITLIKPFLSGPGR